MKICHVCNKECDENELLCPDCGASLVEEEEKAEPEQELVNPVVAVNVDDPVDAEIFADVLKDNGIPFYLGEEETSAHMGFGGMMFSVQVYVGELDLEKAQELYKEVLSSKEDSFEENEQF